MPEFEWDEIKERTNFEKHGISFVAARKLFDGRPVITRELAYRSEQRYSTTGELELDFYTAVWTWRGDQIRLISVRRASREERREYRQIQL